MKNMNLIQMVVTYLIVRRGDLVVAVIGKASKRFGMWCVCASQAVKEREKKHSSLFTKARGPWDRFVDF